ncbi:hypothetical protein [Mesorhizobium delmotii]|uniref:Antitoxin Xre/MbcA/ParS-like toxin-binding domain-containing protein n=1 Tax=Mesorhizobium delmotii TaxID=1631247 RepID=A0A2P9AR38_9HYPH|nr:hypothetical protein [Mesorhizobium delmotii]SJM33609.1 conserved hypothetical protein [Mesorhizobium delmotii]
MSEKMTSEQATTSGDLDPVVRAVAEARAREAGQSMTDYLAGLILASSRGPGPSDIALKAVTAITKHQDESDPWPNNFSRQLLATVHDLYHQDSGEDWRKLVAGPEPWLASELSVSPALHLVAVFNYRIQCAALLMGAAFHEADVTDFKFHKYRHSAVHRSHVKSTWYGSIISDCVVRSKQIRSALTHRWQPTPRAERLAIDAFVLLSDLTPARTELLRLCRYDRPRAFSELAKHIDLATDQFRLSADLLAEMEGTQRRLGQPVEQSFSDVSIAILERSGGGVSLTEGAKLLGTTRQALHKRVKLGSALGMMHGSELTLPKFQFVNDRRRTHIVEGLGKVVKLFDTSRAGRWSALQFLIEKDPNLGDTPTHVLIKGRVDDVVNAARAYLGADEA